MDSPTVPAARCLNSLLRYELAAAKCYQFAEHALSGCDDLSAVGEIRGSHQDAAARLRERVVADGMAPSADPGMWCVLLNQVESAAAVFGKTAMLTVLLWIEQHAAETFGSTGLDCDDTPHTAEDLLPIFHHHIATLETLIDRSRDRAAKPCGDFHRPQLADSRLTVVGG